MSTAETTLIRPAALTRKPIPPMESGTYFVQTWGCQMNEEDSEQMGLHLQSLGFRPASNVDSAQVVLLNTCSVRRKPEDKAFTLLGELRRLRNARKGMVIGVCGCMAQIRADEIQQKNEHVDFVVGTAQIEQIPGLVQEALQTRRFATRLDLPERKGSVVTDVPTRRVDREAKLKAFVPIQYGCDKFCTFCIVPTTRGRERSRPAEDIVREARGLAEIGTKEITLLGQTVNSYGKNLAEGRVPFANLLKLLAGIPGIERLRYTSPYPRDFKTDLIEVIRDVPQVMEHCHMPLQAGHNDLLARMKRVYTVESFTDIVTELRDAVPWIGLTTDLIVGFPGETEEEFEGTLEAVRRFRFDGAFMFKYSPRPGTPASTMEQLPDSVKDKRLNKLIQTQNQITCEINDAMVGRVFEVLVEGPSPKNPGMLQGYSREFKMLHFEGPSKLKGEIVSVEATLGRQWGLIGRLV